LPSEGGIVVNDTNRHTALRGASGRRQTSGAGADHQHIELALLHHCLLIARVY
jgi:hypothetical protein